MAAAKPKQEDPEAVETMPGDMDVEGFRGSLRASDRVLLAGLLATDTSLRTATLTVGQWTQKLAAYSKSTCI